MFELGKAYIIDDEITVLCIGINPEKEIAVVAPYFADDEDSAPVLHAEYGIDIFNTEMEYENIKPLRIYRIDLALKIVAELPDRS